MHQQHVEHEASSAALIAALIAGILCSFAALTALIDCVMAAIRD